MIPPERIAELRKIQEAATPGPWESICQEFSNHARNEIWTEFGWLNELPRTYREPSIDFIATFNPVQIKELLDTIERYQKALEKLRDGPGNRMSGWAMTWAHEFAGEALK